MILIISVINFLILINSIRNMSVIMSDEYERAQFYTHTLVCIYRYIVRSLALCECVIEHFITRVRISHFVLLGHVSDIILVHT